MKITHIMFWEVNECKMNIFIFITANLLLRDIYYIEERPWKSSDKI